MKAMIFLKMSSLFKDDITRALMKIRQIGGVKRVYELLGPHDAVVFVEFKDIDELNNIIHEIFQTGMVKETDTRLVAGEF